MSVMVHWNMAYRICSLSSTLIMWEFKSAKLSFSHILVPNYFYFISPYPTTPTPSCSSCFCCCSSSSSFTTIITSSPILVFVLHSLPLPHPRTPKDTFEQTCEPLPLTINDQIGAVATSRFCLFLQL